MSSNTSAETIYIGFDFGTTSTAISYTAASFSDRGEFGKVRYIKRWVPTTNSSDKVPSMIAYNDQDRNNQRWGFQACSQVGATCCNWLNLPLDLSAPLTYLNAGFLNSTTATGVFDVPWGMTIGDNVPITSINGRLVVISNNDLLSLYDPVIAKIAALISSRKDATHPTVNKTVLVGGLAASLYVASRLRRAFEIPGKVTVTVPKKPQLAVAIGAGLRAQLGEPMRELTPVLHYGFALVNDAMVWVLNKGSQYHSSHDRSIQVDITFTAGTPVFVPVFACECQIPPADMSDQAVTIAASIQLDLRGINFDLVPRIEANGETRFFLTLNIRTRLSQNDGLAVFTVSVAEKVVARRELRV
ncbi:hypothetical protein BJY00DRAFT_318629 [Aspergillus carlsbadensis]|nr:hypothetical protein BJY00DRAFT_318629 [Aspergillus carlsbadensis]